MAERPYLHPDIYISGLQELTADADKLYLTTQLPTTYVEASVTYAKGEKPTPTISAPTADGNGGYQITITAFSDGTITGEGTVTHFCLVDTVGSRLLAARSLDASQVVYTGNLFSLEQTGGGDLVLGILPPALEA